MTREGRTWSGLSCPQSSAGERKPWSGAHAERQAQFYRGGKRAYLYLSYSMTLARLRDTNFRAPLRHLASPSARRAALCLGVRRLGGLPRRAGGGACSVSIAWPLVGETGEGAAGGAAHKGLGCFLSVRFSPGHITHT